MGVCGGERGGGERESEWGGGELEREVTSKSHQCAFQNPSHYFSYTTM